ncbi:MAG: hypothetical protein ACXABF_13885 [Candidatus Thorarchaeota archaeon]
MAELTGDAKVAEARRQTAERVLREERERSEHTIAYNETRKKGYVPDKETLLAQIEALYAEGKISEQEYEWGMNGLELVHGFVSMSEDVINAEFGF